MKFKNLKPVECTREEFELVKNIVEESSCLAAAVSIVRTALIRGSIEWECETKIITTTQVQDMAYNTVQAVWNGYKYLKIADEKASRAQAK